MVKRWHKVSFGILLLNIADIITTLYLLSVGKGVEANPIMRYLIEWSRTGFVMVKLSLICILFSVSKAANKEDVKAQRTLLFILAAYLFVVINNLIIVLK